MNLALPYTSIITPAEVWTASMKSFGRKDFEEPGDSFYNAAVVACQDITGQIEDFLNRRLIVHRRQDFLRGCDWEVAADKYREPGESDGYARLTSLPPMPPAVDIIDVDGSASLALLVEIIEAGSTLRVSEEDFEYLPASITYFAGYRRADQVVNGGVGSGGVKYCGSGSGDTVCDELTDEASLSDLSEVPGLLPGGIHRAALRMVIYELREELRSLTGFSSTSKTIEGVAVDHERVDPDFIEKEMQKLRRWRLTPRR